MVAAVVTGATSPSARVGSLRFWAVELSGMSAIPGVGQIGPWCSIGVCQSKMSFSSSEEKLTFSVLPAPLDGFGVDFGWVGAEKLAGYVMVGWTVKKAAAFGNWKQRKLMSEV
ncbi:hypothetical protein V6N12_013347 [Hibiscus sabdariffa]|uniref:Uncharacterized protein n=1 Tax=Hibiscus sabdariffa TaxID=183260 RepID=A0ABR2D6L9_9ROSI